MGGPFSVKMKNAGTISLTSSAYNPVTLAAGSQVLSLNPASGAFGALLVSLAAIFGEYRFKRLEIILHPGSQVYAAAYYPEVLTTPPTTIAQVSTATNSIVVQNASTEMVPRSLFINQKSLIGDASAKWWKTTASTAADAWDEDQGSIVLATAAATSANVEFKFHVQFTSAGTGQGAGFSIPRKSIVRDRTVPCIDLFLPDLKVNGFPPGLKLEDEWKRSAEAFQKLHKSTAEQQLARLSLL